MFWVNVSYMWLVTFCALPYCTNTVVYYVTLGQSLRITAAVVQLKTPSTPPPATPRLKTLHVATGQARHPKAQWAGIADWLQCLPHSASPLTVLLCDSSLLVRVMLGKAGLWPLDFDIYGCEGEGAPIESELSIVGVVVITQVCDVLPPHAGFGEAAGYLFWGWGCHAGIYGTALPFLPKCKSPWMCFKVQPSCEKSQPELEVCVCKSQETINLHWFSLCSLSILDLYDCHT